jgi:acetyltransferase
MDFFFEPKGVAVVGATPEPYSSGRNLLVNLTLGYQGPVYPVNPKYDEILGFKCYPRISDINGPLDLALILVPAQAVPQVLEECIIKGVRGAMIESSGFAEVGPEGKAIQDQCLTIAHRGGMRLWGPNCMGLMDISRQYIFSFVLPEAWQGMMNPGHVSLIVQSGLLSAGFTTTLMGNKTLGLAKVCSIGNKSDVEETELLEYLLKDPTTKVIALYLESFIHGRRFFELADSSDKPIVVLKGGKSPLSAEASASHTASLAGNYDLIRGVLRQAGIHQADDFFEMVDIARTLEKDFHLQQPPQGKARIAILTYSGSAGIVTTDHMEKYDLTLARLSPETRKRLEKLSPPWMPVKNPVDYWPAAEKHGPPLTYKHAIETLHNAPEVDGLIVHLPTGFGIWTLNMREIMSVIKGHRKPVLFWLMGPENIREIIRKDLEEEGWPTFYEIHRTVRVMASLFDQSRRGKKSLEKPWP